MTFDLPPWRITVAVVATVVALAVLGVGALVGRGSEPDPDDGDTNASTSTTSGVDTTEGDLSTTSTSVVLRSSWYPKETSRYSERQPTTTAVPPTVSVPPATTPSTPGPG